MSDFTFDEYEALCAKTAVYPEVGEGTLIAVNYAAIGLSNEAGEALGKVKKAWRDDGMTITPERRAALLDEVGDVLWYAARLATELETSLEQVAKGNLDKLAGRLERGTIGGSGDNR